MSASPEAAAPSGPHRVGRGARPYKKVSVTLPADLLDEIRAEVGPGNLSHYLTEAAEQRRRHEALDEWIARMVDEHGPVPEQAVEEAERRWAGSGEAR